MQVTPDIAPPEIAPPEVSPLDRAPSEARPSAAELAAAVERLEAIVERWEPSFARTARAYRDALDALNAEAMRRLIAIAREDPAARAALRLAAADDLVYAVLRRHGLVKPSLQERVEAALDGVRPMLATHGGDVALVRVIPPSAIEVRFTGACESCPASVTTFALGVKTALAAQCPEITDVRQVKGLHAASPGGGVSFVSPFAANETAGWLAAGKLDDIPEDGVRYTTLDNEAVVLARVEGAVTCYRNACAHLGLSLENGFVADGTLRCPHHGFVYELASGECLTARGVQLVTHGVRVTGDDVFVRLAR